MTEAGLPAREAWQAFLERHPATATVGLTCPLGLVIRCESSGC
jgi:hypothetical protein